MTTHELKCWNPFFADVAIGEKIFEIRKNDRDFQLGDELLLREWDHIQGIYTGRNVKVIVTYITAWEQKDGWVVMGIKVPTLDQGVITSRSILKWGLERMRAHAEAMLEENERLKKFILDATYEAINPTEKVGSSDTLDALKATVFQAREGGERVHEAPKDFFGNQPQVRGL